ncbi:MAG: hypothetical protein J6V23_07115 [Bacteroidaceae bacterium]|nr:hypothetical protein [Bacteroidaceae bacterium]
MASAGRILIMPKGNYDPSATYEMLDLVSHNGSSWIARTTVAAGIEPNTINNLYWQQMSDFALLDNKKQDRVIQIIPMGANSSHTLTFDHGECCILFVRSTYYDYSCIFVCHGIDKNVYTITKLSEKSASGKLSATVGTEFGKDLNTITFTNGVDEAQEFILVKLPF